MNDTVRSEASGTERLLVHGRDLPAQGIMLLVHFGSHGLRIDEPQGAVEVPYDHLTTRPGGWSGESLLLEWESPQGERSLLLDHPQRFEALVQSLPQDMQQRLDVWQRDVRRNRRVLHAGLVGVITLTMLPLIAVSVLMLNAGSIARRAVEQLPDAWVQELDEQVVHDLHVQGRVRQEGAAAARFESIAATLAQQAGSDVEWNFLLVDDPRRNAMALPGGTVIVWSGLVRDMHGDAELAGVLAHEMQHVMQRHTLQVVLRQLGMRTSLGLVLFGDGTLGEVDARTRALLLDLKYTREQERQARDAAEQLAQRAGWDAAGYDALVSRLDRLSSSLPGMLVAHPQPGGRQRAVATPAMQAQDVDPGWQAVLDDLDAAESSAPEEQRTPG
jgi:Zn-dependent protease with chaperone function